MPIFEVQSCKEVGVEENRSSMENNIIVGDTYGHNSQILRVVILFFTNHVFVCRRSYSTHALPFESTSIGGTSTICSFH